VLARRLVFLLTIARYSIRVSQLPLAVLFSLRSLRLCERFSGTKIPSDNVSKIAIMEVPIRVYSRRCYCARSLITYIAESSRLGAT
jgi:hypothetical protein